MDTARFIQAVNTWHTSQAPDSWWPQEVANLVLTPSSGPARLPFMAASKLARDALKGVLGSWCSNTLTHLRQEKAHWCSSLQ